MTMIKTIATILNALMILILLFVTRGFSWKNQKDHSSIIGFVFMILLHMENMILIWC